MKKIILIALVSYSFVACGEKKIDNVVLPPAETPKQIPTPPVENPPVQTPPSGEQPVDKALEQLRSDVAFYRGRYNMPDVYKKITDDRGNGFVDLYGTRNMREVLVGVYYRGGANNKYHKTHPRSNTNPLPADGLDNLCKDGFSTALYYYDTNYKTAKPINPCALRTTGAANTLKYTQLTAFSIKDYKPFLQMIHDRIKGKLTGPIYGHCWNGWHASGMMAAIALKQYCGLTDAEADAYWVKNTDGNSAGYDSVRKKVKAFKAVAGLEISNEEKSLICPR